MLGRRALLIASATLPLFDVGSVSGASVEVLQSFDRLLAQTTANGDFEQARGYRELDFRVPGPSAQELAARPSLGKKYQSDKHVSDRARDLIIRFEVSGQSQYHQKYEKPVWPKGRSGVTIGIGYDVGYTTAEDLASDWDGLLDGTSLERLAPACGIKGDEAADLVAYLQDVSISWPVAVSQFERFLKFVAGETIHAFPGAENLSDDSFGALVSLVYNRGSASKSAPGDQLDRRREIRTIKTLVQNGQFDQVPDQIRSMKRLWAADPNARGLLVRRDLEAELFSSAL